MPSIATTLLLLSLLLAHISAQVISPIRILYRWELEPDNHGIAAFNNGHDLVAQACAPTLDTGIFEEHPLSISVDHETPWIGTITVGPKTHTLTSHPRERDDPSCSWIYNEHVIEVDCLVGRNGSMSITTTAPEEMSCFSEAYQAWDLTAAQKLHDPPRTMLQGPQPHGQQRLGRTRESDWLLLSSVLLICNIVGLPMIVKAWMELLRA